MSALQSRLSELSAINSELDARNGVLMQQIAGLNTSQAQLVRACEEAQTTQVRANMRCVGYMQCLAPLYYAGLHWCHYSTNN